MLDYTITEIRKKIGTPYHMANKDIANQLYPYIKNVFPNLEMFEDGIHQWFIVSDRAKNKLRKQFEERLLEHKKIIVDLQFTIDRLI